METWRLSFLPSMLRWLFSLLAAFGIMMLSLEGTAAFAAPPERSEGVPRTLSFDERVDAQRAVEEVLWKHRIWPTDNPDPKPHLSAVLSEATLRGKVTDILRKSNALERLWNRPITGAELRSEIDRMARDSRQPDVLREIFAALHDDPYLIAEALARPALADRMLRSSFARDSRSLEGVRVEDWWNQNRSSFGTELPLPEGSFFRPTLDDASCANDTWQPISLASAPAARAQHSMIWTGAEVIVWGGHPGVSGPYLQSGGRYVPATDSWTPMTNAGAPEGRIFHTAVWTGTEMIVWGGENSVGTKLNTGGRYNPAGDTWAPTGTGTGLPEARRFAGSVWTGTEAIVWGGQGSVFLNSGGRYNPSTDTWTPTGMGANLPPPNSSVFAWTGSVMIVLTGSPAGGGLYNPNTDSWSAVSTSGTTFTSGRASVWTGAELILWNGTTGISRYNPSTNQWTQTTASGAPVGSSGDTAVWANGEMIVWGGYQTVTNPLNTGGRYDPASNTWTPTGTVANVPAGRYNHRAVWIGTEMIVWGGTNNSSNALDTGGRYCRSCDPSFTHYRDADSDTFGTGSQSLSTCNATSITGFVGTSSDCVDSDSTTYPGAPQICDGLNNDCLDPNWPAVPSNEANADNDLYRICQGDCDDSRFTVFPGAPQLCDGLNNNCLDGAWPTPPANEADQDGDGFRICNGDCFDTNSQVWNAPVEIAGLSPQPGNPTVLNWASQSAQAGPETIYNVVGGTIPSLLGNLDLSSASCLGTAATNNLTDMRPPPAVLSAYWYLARGSNSCGTGTYGVGSFGLDRDGTIPACP
jgi:hypothetical protein